VPEPDFEHIALRAASTDYLRRPRRRQAIDWKLNIRTQRKPFSMIREFHLADWFTLGNAICGTAAIFATITYVQSGMARHVYFASGLIFVALMFDVLDGRIARWRRKSSAMGRELDSLSDVISFGVAPAMLGYGFGMQGLYDRIALAYFVACGVSRLARYNITAETMSEGMGKVKFFEGTPIPTSFAVVCVIAVATYRGHFGNSMWFGELYLSGHVLHPLTLMFALSGSLMISRIHIPKL
jgi:CDP-diacylglycerol---serine O-phosphatidyltransferase